MRRLAIRVFWLPKAPTLPLQIHGTAARPVGSLQLQPTRISEALEGPFWPLLAHSGDDGPRPWGPVSGEHLSPR